MAVVTLLFGCACGTAMETEELAETSSKIVSGTDSNRESVVLLRRFDGEQAGALCSGTMIAKNLVLTARHCVSQTTKNQVVSDHDVRNIFVFTGISAREASATKAKAAARGRLTIGYESDDITGLDVALIVLDRDLNVPNAKVASAAPTKGEKLVAVGYGRDENGAAPTKRQETTNRSVIANEGSEFLLEKSTCKGDSGGPAMRGDVVVGVLHGQRGGVAGECVGAGATSLYTSVASVADLVDFGRESAAEARAAQP